ncbi:MAG: hypothetical protein ACRDGN_02185 [bacterium]
MLAIVAAVCAVTRRPLPSWFWLAIVVVLAILAVQVVAGVATYIAGARPRRGLHIVYGVCVVIAGAVQYGLRPGGFLRRQYTRELTNGEARILGLVCLTQFALIARAWMTGAGR